MRFSFLSASELFDRVSYFEDAAWSSQTLRELTHIKHEHEEQVPRNVDLVATVTMKTRMDRGMRGKAIMPASIIFFGGLPMSGKYRGNHITERLPSVVF